MKTNTKAHAEFELKMQEWTTELYSKFNETPEKRREVFETFDEAIEKFQDRPKVKEYFENLKNAFLSLEVKN